MRRVRFLPVLALALAMSMAMASILAVGGCSRQSGSASADPAAPADPAVSRSATGVVFTKLSFDEALEKARKSNSLVMVDVYTDWCGWCRKLDEDVFADTRVGTASKGLVAIKLDAEHGGEKLAERFQIEGFPTVLFLDGRGNLVSRVNGYVNRDRMLEVMAALPRTRS
ncbi:MAG: thioredoxin fold domain-containing protein [Thermoanaerobaculia bacterium]